MKCVRALVALAGLFFIGPHVAAISVENQFLNRLTCESALGGTFADSVDLRIELKEKLTKTVDHIRANREGNTINFLSSVDSRSKITIDTKSEVLKELSVQAQLTAPPAMAVKTHRYLSLINKKDVYDGLTTAKASEVRDRLLQDARKAVEEDPYIRWLKSLGKDPSQILFGNLNSHSRNFLPSQVATVRMYSELDPELTPKQVELARKVLTLYAAETLARFELNRYFTSQDQTEGSEEAWLLAPNIESAKQNYQKILEFIRFTYSHKFSRSEYESAQRDPTRLKEAPDLAKLITQPGMTYELLLLKAFGDEGSETIEKALLGLDTIIEVSQTVNDPNSLTAYLMDLKERVGYLDY